MSESKKPRYLLVGDTHGDHHFTYDACLLAQRNGVETLVQLGDWGFHWPKGSSIRPLAEQLRKKGCRMMFIEGNHDWHTELWRMHRENEFPPELLYMPRGGSFFTEGGVRVGCLGGANSIDRDWRTEGEDWWPEEVVTQEQVDRLPEGDCPVLLTHDAPALPPRLGPPPLPIGVQMDALCRRQRELVRRALERTRAQLLIHGHYHHAESYELQVPYGYGTARVVAMSNNGRKGSLLFVDEMFQPVDTKDAPLWW